MHVLKRAWLLGWDIAIALGFAGLGVLGIGLILAPLRYPTGLFWGVIVVLMGLFGVCLAVAMVMTRLNGPGASTADPTG